VALLARPETFGIFGAITHVTINTSFCSGRSRWLSATLVAAVAAVCLGTACASARISRADEERDPYVVTATELAASARANLYDALFELRPRWFTRANRADPYVYVQDQILGTSGALRRFVPHQVSEARYLSPTEAQVQYGQRNLGRPAIVLRFERN
jgi:hypothetical protein